MTRRKWTEQERREIIAWYKARRALGSLKQIAGKYNASHRQILNLIGNMRAKE